MTASVLLNDILSVSNKFGLKILILIMSLKK